ncbi:MAG: hypothetical protein FWC91_08665 [Defluviitaleaceae bacterium]|nr:hypothetical protein [Defluviitaleaceae bacterium]
MANVDVSSEIIANAQRACLNAIGVLEKSIERIRQSVADCGWKDEKFNQLHNVAQGCAIELNNPIKDLNDGVKKLDEIYKVLNEYENTSL